MPTDGRRACSAESRRRVVLRAVGPARGQARRGRRRSGSCCTPHGVRCAPIAPAVAMTSPAASWSGRGACSVAQPRAAAAARPALPVGCWSAGELLFYYVNLETPFAFAGGVRHLRPCARHRVRPDRSWYYKPRSTGSVRGDRPDERRHGRRGAPRCQAGSALIEACPPFDAGLESWRPDPAWPVPVAPGWDGHATEIRHWVRFPSGG